MSEFVADLEQGAIVWARVADPRSRIKTRPLIILTSKDEFFLDEPVAAVAVTTTFAEPPASGTVPLPWHPRGQTLTGLTRRSAAVCQWVIRLRPSEVIDVCGIVPKVILLEIIKEVQRLKSSDLATDEGLD